MKTKSILLALLLSLGSLSAFAQMSDTYMIPVAANVSGAFGTRWMTQFSLFNPSLDYTLKVRVVFLPTGGAQSTMKLIELPPSTTAFSDNILAELFNVSGSGALLIATFPEDNPGVPDDVFERAVLVNTSTYNNSPAGTFGQTIPGALAGLLDYEYEPVTAVAHGIRNVARDGWRTNIGAVNLGRCSTRILVSVYDADGFIVLEDAPFTVPPQGHIQDRLPVEVDGGSVEFRVVDPCSLDDEKYAVIFPYTSTIDQFSGDPTYQSPALLATPKYLFGKKPVVVNKAAAGKKIDTVLARRVSATASNAGVAVLPTRKK